jgi:hypothetical protein
MAITQGPTDAEANAILDARLGDGSTKTVRLWTAKPNPDGSGGTQVTGSDYAGKVPALGSAAGRRKTNSSQIVFTNSATSPGYGTIVAVTIHKTSDNSMEWFGDVVPAKTVSTGAPCIIAAGELSLGID